MSPDTTPAGPERALHRLLDALADGGPCEHDVVRDGVAALIDTVGEATVHLLEMIDRRAPLTVALSHAAVAEVLELCNLGDAAPLEVGATTANEVAVSISRRPLPHCDVCGGERGEDHGHVADIEERRLLCVCDACRLLLEGQDRGRLRSVPADSTRHVTASASAPDWWEHLDLPVGLVFLLQGRDSSELVAAYPGPAGIIESALAVTAVPSDLWPVPDTEALIVFATESRFDAWLAPVTVAYTISGRLRVDHVMGDPMLGVRDILADLLP